MLSERLASALPESIIFPHDAAFERSMKSYWAQQECEGMFFRIAHLCCKSNFRVHVRDLRRSCYFLRDLAIGISDCKPYVDSIPCRYAPKMCLRLNLRPHTVVPACVVRPHNTQQLCTAVTILKHEFNERRKRAGEGSVEGLFAVRSGGHSPVPGAASIQGGILIDLSLFREVTPSEDGSSVVIGVGAKWMDVSTVLDEKGLAVVGGRNSAVGVGGLTLGGKLLLSTTYFSVGLM